MGGIYDSMWADDGAEEGASGSHEAYAVTKELLVVLIDCRPNMLQPRKDSNRLSFYQSSLEALAKYARRQIIASSSNEMAVVMYGTVHQNSELMKTETLTEFENIYVQHNLGHLTAQRIKDLERLADQNESQFNASIGTWEGSSEASVLAHGLWTASQMFSKSTATKSVKRVWIFTDNDFQFNADQASRATLMNRAKALTESKVELVLHPLSPDGTFQMDPMWKAVLGLSEEEAQEVADTATARLERLFDSVYRKSTAKRTLARLKWTLMDGVTIAVYVYSLVGRNTKSATVPLLAQTNKPLHRETANVCADAGAYIHDVSRRFTSVRGEKVVLPSSLMERWRERFPAGIALLGFKSMDSLKDYHQIKSPQFLYPDDETIKGSTSTFIALHAKMESMKVMAIVRIMRPIYSMPRLAALVPQQEMREALDGGRSRQIVPPGMHVIFLPFADDVRKPEAQSQAVCLTDDKAVDAAAALISSFSLAAEEVELPDTISTTTPNPALQQHYSVLHALALGEPAEPSRLGLEDCTDFKLWEREEAAATCKEAAQRFQDHVYGPEGLPAAKAKTPAKRKAGDGGAEEAPADVAALAAAGRLNTLTVDKLRAFLEQNGLRKTGKKAELMDRVAGHVLSR
mmetsp:Transcript_4/g.5  ORF Transcript_4/g.5 Transcript_4/m.5 type:complete len:631 (-) Transcript_4:167-2059(-)